MSLFFGWQNISGGGGGAIANYPGPPVPTSMVRATNSLDP